MIPFQILFDGRFKIIFTDADLYPMRTCSVYPASSNDNDFIPFHALLSGRMVNVNEKKTLIYSLDLVADDYRNIKNHEEFFEKMIVSSQWFKLVKKNILVDYRCRAGQLIEVTPDGRPILLASLVVNKAHLFNINKAQPDYSQFFLAIDYGFANSERHANLFKTFVKYYVTEASKYIDIIHTRNIVSLCYKHAPVIKLTPKTIAEAKLMNRRITNQLVNSLLKNEPI